MSKNIKALAIMLAAALCAPLAMAQTESNPPAGGSQSQQTPTTPTTATGKMKAKHGKHMIKKGEKKEKKGANEMKKGEKEEKKGMQEEKGATTPSNAPSTNP